MGDLNKQLEKYGRELRLLLVLGKLQQLEVLLQVDQEVLVQLGGDF